MCEISVADAAIVGHALLEFDPPVKLSRSAFFDCEKCILNKMHPTTTANSVRASNPKPHTTTLEIIQAYFKQITPPPGAQIKKQKILAPLKIQFQVGSVLSKQVLFG